MSVAEIVEDLLALDDLVSAERDPVRRRSLEAIRAGIARQGGGAKVADAAMVLGVSQPTVRSWIDAGLLPAVPQTKPVRIDLGALAATKRALDLIRPHAHDRRLLIHVMRLLRDRAALDGSAEGFDDLRAGRVVPRGADLRAEIESRSPPTARTAMAR